MVFPDKTDCPIAGLGPIPRDGSYNKNRWPITRIVIHATAGWPSGPAEEGWRYSNKSKAKNGIFGLAKPDAQLRKCYWYKGEKPNKVKGKGDTCADWERDKALGYKLEKEKCKC